MQQGQMGQMGGFYALANATMWQGCGQGDPGKEQIRAGAGKAEMQENVKGLGERAL
jgi:hypothetical protein